MANTIDRHVSVTLFLLASGLVAASFGTALILTDDTPTGTFTNNTKSYADLTELELNFATTTDTYKAATALLAQSPAPSSFKVGKRASAVSKVQTLVFDAPLVTSNLIDGVVNGDAITQTPFNTDNATTLSDIATNIAAHEAVLTAVSDGTDTITVTANLEWDLALSSFVVTAGVSQAGATIATTVAGSTVIDDLGTIITEDNDWYALTMTSTNKGAQLAAASRMSTETKLSVFRSSEAGIKDSVTTTDVASKMQALDYDDAFVLFSSTLTEFSDAALLGKTLSIDPGIQVAAYKTLTGVSGDTLTEAEKTTILSKNASYYAEVSGVSFLYAGKSSGGLFFDLVRDIDYYVAQLQEAGFAHFLTQPKVPFTDGGIAGFVAQLSAVNGRLQEEGVLADNPAPTVSAPAALSVSDAERQNRNLPDVKITARVAGAIQSADITVTVTQ